MKKLSTLGCICLLPYAFFIPASLSGETLTWDESLNVNIDASWSNSANWKSEGLPSATTPSTSTDVVIGTTPVESGIVTLDTASSANTVNSVTFANGIGYTKITPGGPETLTINSGITNLGSLQQEFATALIAGGSSTWSGSLKFSGTVQINTNTVTLVGTQEFTNDLTFSITNTSTFGKFIGSTSATYANEVNINIGGTYTGALGNTFDFTTGNFNNATLGALPTLSAGLEWNTSQLINSGILTVEASAIPEPSTFASLAGVFALGFVACRKRRQAA